MKKHLYFLAIAAISFTACGPVYVVHQDPVPAPAPPPAAPPQANPEDVTYQNFYDQLSPYGQWIDDPNYGYVWLPDAGPDFKPYATNGHWVYTDEGWAWDSGYPWGWATFHYGRWFFQDGYGWMWIPGTEWAPAWVSWRNSDEYYGWAPMGPNVSYGAAYGGGYAPPPHYWCFVPHQYIASPQVNNYYVRETNNVTIINRTTIINNTSIINNTRNVRYGAGPDPGEVGRYTGGSVRPMSIRESRTPGERADNGSYTIYRPRVNGASDTRTGNAGRPFAPSRVQNLNNARPVNTAVYGNNGNNNTGNNNGWRGDRNNGGYNNDRNNNGGNNDRNYNDRNNSGRTNAGFPNNPPTNPAYQPNNPPAQNNQPGQNNQPNRPYSSPFNRPDNRGNYPQSQPNNPPVNQPANQPNNPPGQPGNQPFQHPGRANTGYPASPNNPQQVNTNNQPANAPVNPPAQNNPFNRPVPPGNQPNNRFGRPFQPNNQPGQQQSTPNQQQSAPNQPAGQPVQQRSPAFNRPVNTMPAGRPFNPSVNPNQPRPVVNQPQPESRPATPPPPPKKDDPNRPGRS